MLQTNSHIYNGKLKQISNLSLDNASGNSLKYNGKELQNQRIGSRPLGFYDYGARFYDPTLGRWHSIDPYSKHFTNQSPYNYAFNNPIKFVDHGGKTPAVPVVVGGVVVFVTVYDLILIGTGAVTVGYILEKRNGKLCATPEAVNLFKTALISVYLGLGMEFGIWDPLTNEMAGKKKPRNVKRTNHYKNTHKSNSNEIGEINTGEGVVNNWGHGPKVTGGAASILILQSFIDFNTVTNPRHKFEPKIPEPIENDAVEEEDEEDEEEKEEPEDPPVPDPAPIEDPEGQEVAAMGHRF